MKVKCPLCGEIGVLQKRGNSIRVIHYGYNESGKRVFWQHTITNMVTENPKKLVTENHKSSLKSKNTIGARGLARIGHRPPKPRVGGSIPPGPAKNPR